MLGCFAFTMVLMSVGLILLQLAGHFASPAGGAGLWRALAVSQFVAGVVFALVGFEQYRCPSCNEIIRGHDRYYLGVVIDPGKCPHCGRRLK